tara:strand:+ start:501 stop:821 length:321 start_codon:yes stop_codon:yes gene_type:complete
MTHKNVIVLEIKYHVQGTTHDGYCSGNEDSQDLNYFYKEEYKVTKDFVKEFIDDNDQLDEYKLDEYTKLRVKSCKGSGYCNTYANHIAVSGKLIEKKNLKAKFLAS